MVAASGAERLSLAGHAGVVNACAVSPDGQWIVSASWDETLKVWNAATDLCLATFHADDGPLAGCA